MPATMAPRSATRSTTLRSRTAAAHRAGPRAVAEADRGSGKDGTLHRTARQVTIAYEDDVPVRLDTVVVSTQHADASTW